MAVTLSRKNVPGLFMVLIDFGTGQPPVNTQHQENLRLLEAIDGVPVDSVGGLQGYRGVFAVQRYAKGFTDAELKLIQQTAEVIAERG